MYVIIFERISSSISSWERKATQMSHLDLVGLFRATNILKHYRAFELPQSAQFGAWLNRLFAHPVFKSTCSTEDLYLDSYER